MSSNKSEYSGLPKNWRGLVLFGVISSAYLAGCATNSEDVEVRGIGCEELWIKLDKENVDPVEFMPPIPGAN